MKQPRRDSIYEMTAMEERALGLYRTGLSLKGVGEVLGMSKAAAAHHIYLGMEKERAAIPFGEMGKKLEYGVSSLSKARGGVRMEGTK